MTARRTAVTTVTLTIDGGTAQASDYTVLSLPAITIPSARASRRLEP